MSARSLPILAEAALLVLGGAVAGVLCDLALPGGVIGRTDEVLFHLESLVEVRLLRPEEAAQRVRAGGTVIVDLRSRDAARSAPLENAVSFPVDEQASLALQEEVLRKVATLDAVVVFGPGQEEDARRTAQKLVLEFSAATASTVEGGAEALAAALTAPGRSNS